MHRARSVTTLNAFAAELSGLARARRYRRSTRGRAARGSVGAARRRQDDAGAALSARSAPGAATARSSCSSRGGWRHGLRPAAWHRCSARQVGETVGYRMRLDSRISAKTRIEVVTEGVFARMILDDPELSGVSHGASSTNSTSARWMRISAWRWRSTCNRRCATICASS